MLVAYNMSIKIYGHTISFQQQCRDDLQCKRSYCEPVTMLMSTFSSEAHYHMSVQPHRAASMTADI